MNGIEKIIPPLVQKKYYIKNTNIQNTNKTLINKRNAQIDSSFEKNNNKIYGNTKKLLMYIAGIGAIILSSLYLIKGKGIFNRHNMKLYDNSLTHKPNGADNIKDNNTEKIPKISEYITELTKGLETYLGKRISPEQLSSVMDKKEFLESVSKLCRDNYVFNKENVENGIFRADLHSHSNYSDGKTSIEDIMNQAALYGDKLFKKTGEKFIFALTDHDTAEGSKEALKIIASNPDKFKNIRFVVGSEISYLIKSFGKTPNQYETAEILAYGFNPFSDKVETFFKDVLNRRQKTRQNYIKDLLEAFPDIKFSEEEFLNVFLGNRIPHVPIMNSYWQLYHYGQIKRELSYNAAHKKINPEEYFKKCMENPPEKLYFNEFKKSNIIEPWVSENEKIIQINEIYKPHDDSNGKLVKTSENTIDDIIEAFKEEKDCIFGFAHPYYISEKTEDVNRVLDIVKSKLKDMLRLTESYHQAYSQDLIKTKYNDIDQISKMCEEKNLLPIGGRDNHSENFISFENIPT